MKPKKTARWRDLAKALGERNISLKDIALDEKGVGLQDFFNQENVTYAEAVLIRQYAKAIITGDVRSAEFLRDTSGEKPSTELNIQDNISPLRELTVEELRTLAQMYKNDNTE